MWPVFTRISQGGLDAVVGILAGALVLAVVTGAHRLKKRFI
jgi:hypothetical protein